MERLLRLKEIIGDPKAKPPTKGIIPVCRAAWYAGIKAGRYPRPVKLGVRTSAWRESEVRALIEQARG